jgi:hypothetical protein
LDDFTVPSARLRKIPPKTCRKPDVVLAQESLSWLFLKEGFWLQGFWLLVAGFWLRGFWLRVAG